MNNKCVLARKEEIDQTLAAPTVVGKKLLEPLKSFWLGDFLLLDAFGF